MERSESVVGKWAKRIFKAVIVVFCIFVVWRLLFSRDESVFPNLYPTDASAKLYSAADSLTVLTNDVVDEISDKGYFSAYAFYYLPDTGEIQITVRYNDSTVELLGDIEFYAYTVDTSAAPVIAGDDEDESVRLHEGYPIGEILTPVYTEDDERLFYNYRKLIFEGVHIDENTNIIISLCDRGDPSSEHSTLAAHFAEQTLKPHKLSKKEKSAFASYFADVTG